DFRLHAQGNRLAPGLARFDSDVRGFFNRALRAGKVALMQPHARAKCEERTAMERGADLIAKHDALAEFLAGRSIVPAYRVGLTSPAVHEVAPEQVADAFRDRLRLLEIRHCILDVTKPALYYPAVHVAGGERRQVIEAPGQHHAPLCRIDRVAIAATHPASKCKHARYRRFLDAIAKAMHLADVARRVLSSRRGFAAQAVDPCE